MSGAGWQRIWTRMEAAQYEWSAAGATYATDNHAQHLQAQYDGAGLRVAPAADAPAWEERLELVRYGWAGALRNVQTGKPQSSGDRLAVERGTLQEWYLNTPHGLEQGFTLTQAPPARQGSATELVLDLALRGDLTAHVRDDGQALWFSDEHGDTHRNADRHSDSDDDEYRDSHKHTHADADQHADQDTNEHPDADADTHQYPDTDADEHRNPYRNRDEYSDEHAHTNRDADLHQDADPDLDEYAADAERDAHGSAEQPVHQRRGDRERAVHDDAHHARRDQRFD